MGWLRQTLSQNVSFLPLTVWELQVTCDTWNVIHDIWHVTCDIWHVTHDSWEEANFLSNVSFLALTVWEVQLTCNTWNVTYDSWLVTRGGRWTLSQNWKCGDQKLMTKVSINSPGYTESVNDWKIVWVFSIANLFCFLFLFFLPNYWFANFWCYIFFKIFVPEYCKQ